MPTLTRLRSNVFAPSIGALLVLLSFAGAAWYTAWKWWPEASQRMPRPGTAEAAHAAALAKTHDHDHADDPDRIEISEQAQKNIGLVLGQVERRDFERQITLPAIVAEQPGRSHIDVTTHFTGIVTKIHVVQGQAVAAGQPLFDLRLTHEELIQSQTDLLKSVQEIEIIDREIARLEKLTREGGLPGKVLLERQYERERRQATFVAQQQALLLHEMTEEQIRQVIKTKQLIGSITLRAMEDEEMTQHDRPVVLQVHELKVTLGQHVMAGDTLAVLSDHSQLLVEGEAFEQDGPALSRALAENWPLTLLLLAGGEAPRATVAEKSVTPDPLKLLYIADSVDPATRTFHFYAALPNRLVRDSSGPDGRRYVQWQFRPGERLRVQVPVERWAGRLVVPAEAVTRDGVETYVFRYRNEAFQRTRVHVEHSDEQHAVLGDDAAIREGHVIAMSSAQQLQLALKGKSGGALDPHSGHTH
ncbi:MAG: efflux RND transporter periplasmic adaptor subunit [Planctomycetaceae bacterium]|nr:efflux RND transporter periplasmic adaptor subunit [Planctomycetaceae bacterium]